MPDVEPVPERLHTVTPRLVCKGADDAIDFYVKAFGAEEVGRATGCRRAASCSRRFASATRSCT
jgi:uncharacterized glyoxalase superfamily protein PhnB